VGAGNDSIVGGNGYDALRYDKAGAAINVNIGTGLVAGGSGTDTIAGIEVVWGSAFNDTMVGDAGHNDFVGGAGNDSINGGAGVDAVGYLGAASTVNVNLTTGLATGGVPPVPTVWGTGSALYLFTAADANAAVSAAELTHLRALSRAGSSGYPQV
jgi:RTX calcium-binding nonapeptide repeat (4 copies)